MKRKSVSLFLALIMVFTSVNIPVFAEDITTETENPPVTEVTESTPEPSASPTPKAFELPMLKNPVKLPITLPSPEVEEDDIETETTASPQPTAKAPTVTAEPSSDNKNNLKPTPLPKIKAATEPNIKLLALNMEGTDISEDLQAGIATISEGGTYYADSVTTTNDSTNGILVTAGTKAELTLNNVTIDTVKASPIKLESGAQLTLHLMGDNTLKASTNYYAGIAVNAVDRDSDYAVLTIDGEGTLNVTGALNAAGIGTSRNKTDNSNGIHGKIVINGGTINAYGGNAAAAIGTGGSVTKSAYSADIIINGGIVNAQSTISAAGIGSSSTAPMSRITINGGTINAKGSKYGIGTSTNSQSADTLTINGGSVNAVCRDPVSKYGEPLHQIVLRMPEQESVEVTVGSWKAFTDADGKLYPYVTDNTDSFALDYNGKVYYTTEITPEETQYTLNEYDGPPCSCDNSTAEYSLTLPNKVTVNITEGFKREKIDTRFIHETCNYPIHSHDETFQVEIDGEAAPENKAKVENGYLVIYYEAVGSEITLKASTSVNGHDFSAEETITVEADATPRFDISDGNIVISSISGNADNMQVTVGTQSYTVPRSETICITQSSLRAVSNIIEIDNVNPTVQLDGININTITGKDCLTLKNNAHPTLELIGTNTLNSSLSKAVDGPITGASLTISGTGSLSCISASGAGIGGIETVNILGGTVTARGGNGGAGIGGSNSSGQAGNGINVNIKGGRVFAYGNGNAAGIGGGANSTYGTGGNFVIDAGMVHAEPGSGGTGYGIGPGGNSKSAGTVTVNGGSVDATLPVMPYSDGKIQYRVEFSIEDISDMEYFDYSVDEAEKISTSTDENGKLYLYLNAGWQWVRVYADDTTYYCYMNVSAAADAAGGNSGICYKTIEKELTSFTIPGQTEDTQYSGDTVNITVPSNVKKRDGSPVSVPVMEFKGADSTPRNGEELVFSATSDTSYTAQITIIGHDKSEHIYTVNLNLDESTVSGPTVYDVSKGTVLVFDTGIEYGGTEYEENPNGYVITGTTDVNTVRITHDYPETGTPDDIPPITFRDLNITTDGNALRVRWHAKVKIEGDCSFVSLSDSEAAIETSGLLTRDELMFEMTGSDDSMLTVHSENGNAINVGPGTTMTLTGMPAKITAPEGKDAITCGNQSAGDERIGHFITDSEHYMQITSSDNPYIVPNNSEGESLHQLELRIPTENNDLNSCMYKGKSSDEAKEYYIDNGILYLMVPDDQYVISVVYNETEYDGITTVNGAHTTVNLIEAGVREIIYDSTYLTHEGGEKEFTVDGDILSDTVEIILISDTDPVIELREWVKVTDDKKSAVITIPPNTNQSRDGNITYKCYYEFKGKREELPNSILVKYDDTVAKITKFTISGELGESTIYEDMNPKLIVIYVPWDHEFKASNIYHASEIEIVGSSVTPGQNSPAEFVLDYTGLYMRGYYYVTADDGVTRETYEVDLRHETNPPTIDRLEFTNPSTSAGGTVEISASGKALRHVAHAEKEENRHVYIYSDDESIESVEAQYNAELDRYTAVLTVPPNTSDTEDAVYTLKARIGNTEQTAVGTLKVPRNKRSNISIKSFTIEHQIGETEFVGDNIINITMPYDADLTELYPNIQTEDLYATYSPQGTTDFTNPVIFTVTAENKIDKYEYTVNVTRQETPTASGVQFKDPPYSAGGIVNVKVIGQYLDNAAYALTAPQYIQVSARLISGEQEDSEIQSQVARKNNSGDYIASITVPPNNTDTPREYELSVTIGNTVQTLTGDKVLTVCAREPNSKYLSDMILTEGQEELNRNEDNKLVLYVPYNTDLRNIEPQVRHTGTDYSPKGAQNFNNPITYTVYAEDGTSQDYEISVRRLGVAEVDAFSVTYPEHFADTNITADITGKFIPYLDTDVKMNTVEIAAVSRDDGESTIRKEVTYDSEVYGGHATAELELPINNTPQDKIYDIKLFIDGNECPQTQTITVPGRKSRKITYFGVNGAAAPAEITENDENSGSILFTMPYETDLTHILPTVLIDGDSYTPEGEQDFDKKTITYTVSAKGDTARTYTVRAARYGLPSIATVNVTDTPTTFKGSTVNIETSGTFFYDFKVKAFPNDGGDPIDGVVTMDEWHKATATLDIPENDSTTSDKEYTLQFYLDGFENPISAGDPIVITVPRRKTRAITSFIVPNQVGVAQITDTDIYITVRYNTDITSIKPTVSIDGDSYSPEGEQNFNNETRSVVYTVSAADDEDREYTVHIARDGAPEINMLTFTSPSNFRGGSVAVNFEGVFFDSVQVYADCEGSEQIAGNILSFNTGKASAVVELPTNYDTDNAKIYKLRFIIDGVVTSFFGGSEITVPRRTTRAITEFTLPDIQEGETEINGTDINITVPYTQDITAVTPQITYDADMITPNADTPQDFTNPVTYTLSSSGDESVTYTVNVTKKGEDPYLKSMTVENQDGDTVYEGDNISIVLPSSEDLKTVEPILDYVGTDYSPKGAQDFTSSEDTPVVYTVVNEYGVEHKYYVTITKKQRRRGSSHSSSGATPTPSPTPTPEPTTEPTAEPTAEPTTEPTAPPDTGFTPIPDSGAVYISGYGDSEMSEFRPDNTITRAEISRILSVLDGSYDENVVYPNIFPDMSADAWYANYVNFAASQGYISGYEDGNGRPENMITRAEFAAILARFANIDVIETDDMFSDIAQFGWCRNEINTLASMGIISGYEENLFLPENRITRAETVSMINRILGREMTEETAQTLICPFSDVDASHWAYNDILLASCEY